MYEFQFKPFEKMTDEDYAEVGFMSGLEIHQQLLTDKKLFCRCPAGRFSHDYDAEILRHMRPTLSELGVYDGTALMEFKTKKDIIYRIKRESVCTYEMDDTPPFLINDQALDIALETGLLFNCNIIDELHIARKQYLDGSIPTGFQRTAIYALDGFVPYKDRKVKIVQMSIEEDSCREESDIGHTRVYITDRLGMPLIETVTGPDMKTPQEVAEVARLCSKVVRSTQKVRRGAGAAREDVNVSVTGGTRVEIKGVPKIGAIPLLTYNEAKRQWNLLRLREELKKRGITEESFKARSFDISSQLKSPSYLPIKNAAENGMRIKAVVLEGFKDLLRWETQTDTFFSREISDRVRVIACLTTLPNIIHSDSMGDNLTSSEWAQIKKYCNASSFDTVVVVWGSDADTETAAKEIIIRAKESTIGIPSETRQALPDGTNGFERILPGADRMYPDTDLPPQKITAERIKRIQKELPRQFYEREEKYRKLKIPADTIGELSISKFASLFDETVDKWKLDPTTVSVTLIQFPKRLKRKNLDVELLTVETMTGLLMAYRDGLISKDGLLPVMEESILLGKFYPEMLPPPATENDIKKEMDAAMKHVSEMNIKYKSQFNKLVVSEVMHKLRVRADGAKIARLIGFKKEVN